MNNIKFLREISNTLSWLDTTLKNTHSIFKNQFCYKNIFKKKKKIKQVFDIFRKHFERKLKKGYVHAHGYLEISYS